MWLLLSLVIAERAATHIRNYLRVVSPILRENHKKDGPRSFIHHYFMSVSAITLTIRMSFRMTWTTNKKKKQEPHQQQHEQANRARFQLILTYSN